MFDNSKIEKAIENFDGVSVSILSEARVKFCDNPGYVDEIVSLSFDKRTNISMGASWILKAELEEGETLTVDQTEKIISSLNSNLPWQTMLHLCQSIEWLDISEKQSGSFFKWAQSLTGHDRPFLRTWSLHAMVITGVKYQKYRTEALLSLKQSEDDKAASVRARARKLQKIIE